jgi:hypothetical protein
MRISLSSRFQATNATTATNALNLGGVAANQFVLTGDVRLTNARLPLPGSADYIQNTNTQQAAANFNINGTGQANVLRAATQFEIGTERILSSPTFNSIFAGANSGAANTIGDNNSFFGTRSGESNTSGGNNSFFGRGAGQFNETGFQNSFFGRGAGVSTLAGNDNAFFGTFAGSVNIGGSNNSAFGKDANVGSGELTFATAIGAGSVVSSSNTVALGRAVDTVRIPGSLNVTGAINGTVANATTATNALSLGGVAANQYVLTGDGRLSDERNPLPGSTNYIQNSETQQSATNFNISGNGTAGGTLSGNIVNATTQFNLNNQRILIAPGSNNLMAGLNSGTNLTTAVSNTFFGSNSGLQTTTGSGNAFFGTSAGTATIGGLENSFFGANAGLSNNTGNENTFIGSFAGRFTQGGSFNTFVGSRNGTSNFAGSGITLLGSRTQVSGDGLSNASAIGHLATVSQSNSLVLGAVSGVNGSAVSTNVGIGTTAPTERLHVVGTGIFNGNLIVTGTISGNLPAGSANYIHNTTNPQASSNFNVSGNGTAGGTLSGNIVSAATQYNIGATRVLSNAGASNIFAGGGAGSVNTGGSNAFFGVSAGTSNTTGAENAFFGRNTGFSNTTGSNNTLIGHNANVGQNNLTFATAIGSGSLVSRSNSIVLGRSVDNVGIGTTAPTERLHIATNGANMLVGGAGCVSGSVGIGLNGPFGGCTNYTVLGDGSNVYINRPTGGFVLFREGNGSSNVQINPGGVLVLRVLGTSGGTALCRNASQEVAFCSSSLRYKKNIVSFAPGMSFIRQLQPIAYEWKADGLKDVGFGAEDIARIDPRFVTYNDKGEVEGIKYDRLSTAFVNAFREQEAEISTQRTEIETLKNQIVQQRSEIAELKALICSVAPNAAACSLPK